MFRGDGRQLSNCLGIHRISRAWTLELTRTFPNSDKFTYIRLNSLIFAYWRKKLTWPLTFGIANCAFAVNSLRWFSPEGDARPLRFVPWFWSGFFQKCLPDLRYARQDVE
jgi:hypothetical protein